MSDKWVVYVTYGVLVDAPTALEPDDNDKDYNELRTRAVLKMWTHGYNEVKDTCEIDFENVTAEFADNTNTNN